MPADMEQCALMAEESAIQERTASGARRWKVASVLAVLALLACGSNFAYRSHARSAAEVTNSERLVELTRSMQDGDAADDAATTTAATDEASVGDSATADGTATTTAAATDDTAAAGTSAAAGTTAAAAGTTAAAADTTAAAGTTAVGDDSEGGGDEGEGGGEQGGDAACIEAGYGDCAQKGSKCCKGLKCEKTNDYYSMCTAKGK
ncbi:unnamed protein product [Prorocentrum cordatum]|uniref:CBM1 domain-containing protein n=1 Tax=Prorocentrum cordatum TaxID=2364126 RepID=A0ABN9U3K8_9DINO|nr:unnamed protein product [Polarella glacialis]